MTRESPWGFVEIARASTLQVSRWPGRVLLRAGLCTQALASGDIVLRHVWFYSACTRRDVRRTQQGVGDCQRLG